MREIIKLYIVVLILPLMIFGQKKMWSEYGLSYSNYWITQNLSIDSMRSIILSGRNDNSLPVMAYEAAAEYLYYKQKESQKNFLLENLNTKIDTSLSFPENIYNWEKVYINAHIRGLLGDTTAISLMDTAAGNRCSPHRVMAIRDLAEIGRYNDDYYSYLKEQYENGTTVLHIIALYGVNGRYRSDVVSIIEDSLSSTDPDDSGGIIELAGFLGYFDRQMELEKTEEYFYNTQGLTRYNYYSYINSTFKDGQLERSKYGLENEDDDNLRSGYLPSCYRIEVGWNSEKYLEPENINFLLNLDNIAPETRTYKDLNFFIQEFKPAEPDSEATNTEMLEHLDRLIESSYNYNWLQDESYKNELKGRLESAESYLSSSDELNAAREIKKFQLSVEQVHSDSSGSYPKYVSDVGYKFLFYYSQYILDRLPETAE